LGIPEAVCSKARSASAAGKTDRLWNKTRPISRVPPFCSLSVLHLPGHNPKTGVIIKYNRKTVTDNHHQWNVRAGVPQPRDRGSPAEVGNTAAQVIRLPTKP
jgi:hypothetical protein